MVRLLRRLARRVLAPFRPPPPLPPGHVRTELTRDGAIIPLPGVGRLDMRLHPTGDPFISDPIRRGVVFEARVLETLRGFIRPGDRVLDVGGNIGWFTVIASHLVGPTGLVVAVEPDPANAAVLRDNLARNRCANASVVEAAAGAEDGTASLYRSETNPGDHQMARIADRPDAVDVAVRRLDAVVAGHIDVLKMDTQGSEVLALRGMSALLAANPAMRMILEFWPHGLDRVGGTTAELMALLAGTPRRFWLIDNDDSIAAVTPEELIALAAGRYAPATYRHGDLVAVAADDATAIAHLERMRASSGPTSSQH